MTQIKCRYYERRCFKGKEMFGDCDGFDGCQDYRPDPEQARKHPDLINPCCEFLVGSECEFEKTVKQYALDEYGLALRGKYIERDCIDYLEIDGRILIGGAS